MQPLQRARTGQLSTNLSEFKHESEFLMNKNSQYEIVGFKERVMRYEQIKDKKGNWIRNPDLDKKRELVVVVKKLPQHND